MVVGEYQPIVEQFSRFSPFTNSTDSFFVKMFNDEDFVLDTLIPRTDTSHFYMRGYYETFNPFLIKTEKVEVYLFESGVMKDKKKTDHRILTYMIIGITGTGPEDFTRTKDEAKRIYKKMKKVVNDATVQRTKANGKIYRQYLYRVGWGVPFYSKYGVWYKTGTNNCVSFCINLVNVEAIKARQLAQ